MNGAVFLCVFSCIIMHGSFATPLLGRVSRFLRSSLGLKDFDKREAFTGEQKTTMEILDVNEFRHHNYEQMTWYLKYFALRYPAITKLYSIGYSVQNRKLWAMKISSNPQQHDPGEPEIKLVGNIHGNEFVGREVLLQLIKYLCESYGEKEEITKLVDTTGIHILPCLNPDGYELASVKGRENPFLGHRNANGIDINRNFPDQFFPSTTGSPQPETRAAMKWIQSNPFVLSASLHSGALVASYPYDDSPSGQSLYSATPDDDVFRHLAKSYSQTHPIMHLANPKWTCTDVRQDHFIDGVTNGAQWFSISGGMQDYNYVQSNAFEVTLDLGCERAPNASKLRKYWEDNKPALIKFIQQGHKGVRGFVKSIKGKPLLGAIIRVSDRRHDVTTAKYGDYWRLLVPGSYEVTATAKNYEPQTKLVEITGDESKILNFTLRLVNDKANDIESEADFLHAVVDDGIRLPKGDYDPRDNIIKAQRSGRDGPDIDTSNEGLGDSQSSDDKTGSPAQVKYLDLREGLLNPRELAELRNEHLGSSEGSSEEASGASNNDIVGKENDIIEKENVNGTKGSGKDQSTSKTSQLKDKEVESTERKQQTTQNKSFMSHQNKKLFEGPKIVLPRPEVRKTSRNSKDVKAKDRKSRPQSKSAAFNYAHKKVMHKPHAHFKPKFIPPPMDKHFAKMVGSKVRCHATGSRLIKEGILKWVGNLPSLPQDSAHLVAGVELKAADRLGTNGTYRGVRYFMALPKKGYFFKLSDCKTV